MTDTKTIEVDELMPCPFCGGKAEIAESFEGDDGLYDIWKISCNECPAEMRGERARVIGDGRTVGSDEREAIVDSWNSRRCGE